MSPAIGGGTSPRHKVTEQIDMGRYRRPQRHHLEGLDVMDKILSQPEPEHLAHASLTLARVLAGNPDPRTLEAAAAAIAVLGDVRPPYPPHPEHLDPIDPHEGIREAIAALNQAAADATTIPERIRIACGARELTDLTRHAIAPALDGSR